MKKALALILTAAMLFSCLAIGVSAKRVVEVTNNEDVVTVVDKVYILGAEGICNDWGGKDLVSGDFELEVLMYSSNIDGTAPGTMGNGGGAYCGSFYVDFAADSIGNADSKLSYDFQVDTWYDMKWVVEGGDTAVYVNGELVGNLGVAMRSCLYLTAMRDCAISDFKLSQNDEVVYHVTYDDIEYAQSVFAAQGAGDPSAVIDVEFVVEEEKPEPDYVYILGAEGICNDWGGKDLVSGDFTLEVLMYSSNFDGTAPGTMGNGGGSYCGSFYVDFAADSIGSADSKLDYDFQVDTWYDMKWVVEGGDTAVYVNGELVGNLGLAMRSALYLTAMRDCAISDFKLSQDGEVVYHVDYSDIEYAQSVFAAQGAGDPSAVVVVEPEEEKPEPDYVYILGAEGICNDWGGKDLVSGDFELEVLMYSSNFDGTAPGTMGNGGGSYCGSFYVDFAADSIGNADSKLSYDFQADTWYDMKWVVEGGDTAVYVNGEHIGNLGVAMRSALYLTAMRDCAISDFKLSQNGEVVYHVDYSDIEYAQSVFAAQGAGDPSAVVVVEPEVDNGDVTIVNKNINYTYDAVYILGAEGICNDWGGKDLVSGDFELEVLMYSSNFDGDNPGALGYGGGSYVGSFFVDFAAGQIGNADVKLDYTFEVDTWYDLKWVVEGGDTAVYVNGEHVGNLGLAMRSCLYLTAMRECAISDFKLSQDGEAVYHVTYDDIEYAQSVFAAQGALDPSRVVNVAIEGESYDLGYKYLDATAEEYYTWLKDCDGSLVEFDFSPAKDESYISNFTDSITLTTTGAGVGGESVNFASALKAGEWYHIAYVGDGSSTAIYLDGALVGTVNKAVCANSIGGHIGWLAIDNLNVGGNIDDFEDGEALENFSKDGGPDIVSDYDFSGYVDEPEDPYASLGMDVAPEGDAMLVTDEEGGYACIYVPHNGFDISSGNVVYSFDLALVANDHRGDPYSAEKDPDGSQTWFEIWRDTASRRFKVGFDTENEQFSGFAGDNDSLVGFDWGEMTADNFHNVVVVFSNRKAYMYIDGVLLYEGPAGSPGVDGSNATMYAIVGGSAVIDNFTMYNPDLEVFTEDFLGGEIVNNGGLEIKPYGWTVGADCEENGHVFGSIDVTTRETCYSLGEDTKYCAVCGEAYAHVDRAMVDHNYAKYDINRTADGLIYTYCQADGCVEKKFVTPTEEAYTGTMSVYLDMSDDMAKMFSASDAPNIFANFSFEDGVATTSEATYIQNYSRFQMESFANNAPKSKDWSVTFDLTFNGTWDTDDNIDSGYEHYSLFMLGGNNAAFITLNFEKDYVQISPNTYSNPSVTIMKEAYDFVEGETYNVQLSFKQYEVVIDEWYEGDELVQWTEPAVDFYVTINGVDVITYDYETLEAGTLGISYENGEASFPGFFNQNFGVNYSIDNFVVATSDFEWTERTYVGDVDGDNYLTANDALCMRKLLAKVIDDSALATSRMDANGDGVINAKDQLTIRKALAA